VWSKLLINACINPLAALFNVRNNGQLLEAPYHRLLTKLIDETAATAQALGVSTTYPLSQLSEQVKTVIEKTRHNQNSMLKDLLDLDKTTEFDQINGEIIRRARDARIRVPPVHSALNALFSAMAPNLPRAEEETSQKSQPELKVFDTVASYRKHRSSFERYGIHA